MHSELQRIALRTFGVCALMGMLFAPEGYAKKQPKETAPVSRDVYDFVRVTPPTGVEPYNATLYSCDRHSVSTLRGDVLNSSKDTIKSFRVNPAGINYALVSKGKKKSNFGIYDISNVQNRLAKFNTKKYGEPTAVCYSPDARAIYLAAGGKIYQLETRKFLPVRQLPAPGFNPTSMVMSPNGYYLAATDGKNLTIYNCETFTTRKKIDAGEKINDMMFSPDSQDFAVLTADGVLTLYGTRTFDMRKMLDELGQGLACSYNFDGKYIAVATTPNNITVVNLLRDTDRQSFDNELGGVCDVCFITDSQNNTLMAYPETTQVELRRMPGLKPYYNRLIADQVEQKMDEWLKMMPGETMEQYRARVTDETRRRQRQLFEDEIATGFAGNLLGDMGMSLGSYDRSNGVLALNFSDMPTIFVPVPESDVTSFTNANDLTLSDVQYGIMPDDSFEVVYAKITNNPTGKSYIYDNHNRTSMTHMDADDAISIELLQQQQMEELRLQELREKIVKEAKSANVISDHTHIAVNSKVVPDYDADGNKILNYVVSVTYDVEPEFSAVEDFGPGKYHVEESGAASSMMRIVREAFEGDLKQYMVPGRKLRVRLLGTADASPIVHGIPYDGSYGDIDNEPVYKDGQLSALTVTKAGGIKENDQLALLRAMGVKDFLEKNVKGYDQLVPEYRYEVNVSQEKGSAFRRITSEFTFVNAF